MPAHGDDHQTRKLLTPHYRPRPPRVSATAPFQPAECPIMRLATEPLHATPLRPADQSASLSTLFSATRQVAECSEYHHIIPGHPPFCDLSAFDAEHCSKIKFRLASRRWKWTHWTLLR